MLTNKFEGRKYMLVNRAGGLLHRKASVFGPQSRQKLTLKAVIIIWKELSHAPSTPSMNTDESSLGRCPECSEDILEAWVLVEYNKDDGTEGVWAECLTCGDVVSPK